MGFTGYIRSLIPSYKDTQKLTPYFVRQTRIFVLLKQPPKVLVGSLGKRFGNQLLLTCCSGFGRLLRVVKVFHSVSLLILGVLESWNWVEDFNLCFVLRVLHR